MFQKLMLIYKTVGNVFGKWVSSLPKGVLIINFQIFLRITMWMDKVFFPGYKKASVDRPIFIIGNPRSGTTVLQRFLFDSGEVCSFEVWQMICPSVIGQKVLKPFIPFLARFNPAKHYGKDAHETSLDSVETDEALFSFRFLDGLFVLLFFLAWSEDDHLADFVGSRAKGSPKNKRELAFYKECLKRNLYISNKPRILGKPFTFVLRVEDVLEAFPDAKLIYMVRDPLNVIPSGINMLRTVTGKQFNTKALPEEVRQRYYKNLYRGECALYKEFLDVYNKGTIPKENIMIVQFPDLMTRFEDVMAEIMEFAEVRLSDEFEDKIKDQAEKQRSHKSKHKYNLKDFGLEEQQVRKDLAAVYDTFDV